MGNSNSATPVHRCRHGWCAGLLAVSAWLTSACTAPDSAYDAYVECNNTIASADDIRGVLSCYNSDMRELLQANAAAREGWFSGFIASRPVTTELFEEQRINDDESILLIIGQSRFGQPMSVVVQLSRAWNGWKIGAEELHAKGAAQDDARPVRVSLQSENGPEWNPGTLAGSIWQRPNGNCRLGIAHVFDFPSVLITTNCDRFTSPGRFDLQELGSGVIPETGNGPLIYTPVHIRDERKRFFDQVLSGHMAITQAGDGIVSGEFSFEAASSAGHLQIHGSFTNLPFSHGG